MGTAIRLWRRYKSSTAAAFIALGEEYDSSSWKIRSRKKFVQYRYRSRNFSTTRTLSPRTVIGMGTTLS